jgi:DNA-binding transcriptional ArsR family regulator
MEEESKSYYAIIPAVVRYDEELTANAKLLYGEITALSNEKGYCWASNNYFANLYKTSPITVSRWIRSLREKGYIEVSFIYKEGTNEIDKRCIQICKGGINNFVKGGINNFVKENNTSINNTNEYKEKEIIKEKEIELGCEDWDWLREI